MVMDYLGASIPDYSGLDFSQYAPQVPPAATPEPAPQVSRTSGALDTANWDKATLDYYNQLQAYKQQMEGKGFNVYDPNLVYGSFSPQTGFFNSTVIDPSLGISILPPDLLQREDEAYYAGLAGRDPSQVYQSVMEFGDDPKFGSLGRVVADPAAKYRLVDVSGGNKVIYSGTGIDALQAIHALTPEYSKDASSQWRIESLGSGSKEWQSTPAFKPDQSSGFGKWLLGALPMVLIPGFGGAVGKALGVTGQLAAPVGAAAITGATGALAGKSIGDILTGAALAGVGTYAGGKLFGGGGGDGGAAGGVGADVSGALPTDIVVTAPTSIGASLGTVGALTNVQADAATQQAIDQYAGQTPASISPTADLTLPTAPTTGALPSVGIGVNVPEIVVTAPTSTAAAQAAANAATGSVGALGQVALDQATQQAVDQYINQVQQPTLEQQFDETFGTGTPQAPTVTGGGLSSLESPITVVGTPSSALNIAPGIPGIGAGALTSAINATQPTGTSGSDRLEQTQEQPVESKDDIVVKAWNAGSDVNAAAAAAGITAAAAQAIIQAAQTAGTADLRKVAETQTTTGALPPVPSGTGGLTAPEYVDTTPIEVVAEPKPLDLTGPAPVVTIPSGALTEIGSTIPQLPAPEVPPAEDIVVTAEPKPLDLTGPAPVVTIPSGALTEIGNIIPQLPTPEVTPAEEIVVKGKPETQPTPTPVIPPATTTTTTPPTETKAEAKTEAETPKEKSTLDKIVDYLQIAGLGTGLIGDLLGGGGSSGALGTIPAGLFGTGTGTSVFNKPLPAPNLPGLGVGGTGIGARTAADLTATTGLPTPGSGASNIDWYRYGYGPEQSFFKQVPQGAKNASQAFTGYEVPFRGLQNMAEGGYAEADDDANERIARKRIEEEQRASGGNYSVKRNPKFRQSHSFDDGLLSNYMLDVPLGEGSLLLNAGGKGALPDYYTIGAQYPLGDMGLRASHTLHGGSEYGVSGPLLGGDVDVSAYSGRGFVPEGVRLSYRRRFDDGGYAVGGPGDGRDDKIPAMLSDGEYVMDAETVAMLGNGSSKAGADALDRFRVNIRKHKGRSMARGNFSVKAKKPEKYLKKDRA